MPRARLARCAGWTAELFRRDPHELVSVGRPLLASVTLKIVALVIIFVTLPIILYGQFASADRRERELVVSGLQHQSWLIAQALAPLLNEAGGPPHDGLNRELQKYSDDGTSLKLMFRPSALPKIGRDFFYVASAPQLARGQLDADLDRLDQRGILQRLVDTCSWDTLAEILYRQPEAKQQILTSVIPIQSRWGCWVLISSHSTSEFRFTSIRTPYWQSREVRIAAIVYLIGVLLAVLVAISVRRSLRHFRKVAHEIRQGRTGEFSFAARNLVPELASVASDIDHLVLDLRGVAREIRATAEDNAHSFKAPLATMQASMASLQNAISTESPRTQRALALFDTSLNRLRALIGAAQRLDNNTADLIEAPRTVIDLAQLVAGVLARYREVMVNRGIRLARRLDEGIAVRASTGILETVLENIIDNAIGFSRPGATISVRLTRVAETAQLDIEDEGPGIDPAKLGRIFDRYFSLRPSDDENATAIASRSDHAGLGLWIVRRDIEALGGQVTAANRIGGGLGVRVSLPVITH